MNTETIKKLKERAKEMLEDNYDRKIGDEEIYTIICELENFYTAYEKEKGENQKKELAILNAKQIEFNKLVNTVNSYKGQFKRQQKEIEELKRKNKILEVISLSFNEIQDRDKKWKDKIKAKIEEIDEVLKGQLIEKIRVYFEAQKEVLQSLLEKE